MVETRKPPIGSRPGTLAVPADAPKPALRVVRYDGDELEEHTPSGLEEIRALKTPGRKIWVDVQGLGDESLLRGLADLFSIHPLALEDVVHIPIRPKAERYEHNLLIVTQMVGMTEHRRLQIEQVSLLVGGDYVLTFQEQYGDVLDPVRRRLQVQGSLIRTLSSDYLAYAILDTIIDAYYPLVERIGDRIEELEEVVLTAVSNEPLRELNSIKGQLLTLRRAIAPQREAVGGMVRDDDSLVSSTVRMYLRDTYDHVVQTTEAVDSARELLSGLVNTYLSVVSNRMNDVMKTLTIVASIFVPLTFMAGIYGMNFEHMPELHVKWAYPASLAGMTAVAIGMLIYFRSKGWIGRRKTD
jgi:magnesium transporter